MKTKLGIGNQILKILGNDPLKNFSCTEKNRLLGLLRATIALIQSFRIKQKYSWAQPTTLVNDAFPRLRWEDPAQAGICLNRLSQCYEEMFCWAERQLNVNGFVAYSIILNGTIDLCYQRFLGSQFCSSHYMSRSHSWIPCDVFSQAARWYLYETPPQRLPSEFMIIFELRQTLEVAIRRIIGFQTVTPLLKLKHDTVFKILKKHVAKKNFSPPGKIGLDQIKHVYDWTEPSIHMMETDFSCIVWKAISIVSEFFHPTQRKNGTTSIYDNFEIPLAMLQTMRNEFVEELKKLVPKGVPQITISWITPEASIVENGKAVRLSKLLQTVTM